MHLKRSKAPTTWPIPRKGTKYFVTPRHNKKNAVPLLVMLRRYAGLVRTRREAKIALINKEILINGKAVREEKYPLCLFDILEFKSGGKTYKVTISKTNKFELEQIPDSEKNKKISKVLGRKKLKKGMQINLDDGRNILGDDKVKSGDSVILNLSNGKIEKVLELREKAKIFIKSGKHAGESGEIKKLDEDKAELALEGKDVKIKLDDFIVVEK